MIELILWLFQQHVNPVGPEPMRGPGSGDPLPPPGN